MTARARHLVIFARRPQLGVGKRRLAADVGDVEALRFARGALDRLVRTLGRDPRWRLWLAVTPDRPLAWVRAGTALPQGTGDLGQRLTRVIEALPPGPVVVLGSDTPTVTRADIAAACSTSSFCCRHVPCTRERSAIVGERIVLLPDAPMTPAMAGRVPPSAPSARDEPSVSEE